MRRFIPVLMVGGLLTGAAFAQSAAGTWTGEMQGRGGPQAVTLTLAVDGSTLTGTFEQGDQSGPISEGTVDGAMISFQRTVGNGFMITYNGQVEGDTLTLTPEFGGRGGGGGGRGGGGGGAGRGGGRGAMPVVLTRQ